MAFRWKFFHIGHYMVIRSLKWIVAGQPESVQKLLLQNGNEEVVFVLRVQTGKVK